MGIAERKERELQRREDEILAAALRLFHGDDWLAVTMDEIAQAAEIGKGTLYLHFESKEEIYAGLALAFGRRLLAQFRDIDPGLDPAEQIRATVRLFLEAHVEHTEYRRVVEYCYRDDFRRRISAAAQAEFAELDAGFFEVVNAILKRGIAAGRFRRRPIPALLVGPHATLLGAARLLWGGCSVSERPGPREFIREVADFVVAGLDPASGGRPERRTQPHPQARSRPRSRAIAKPRSKPRLLARAGGLARRGAVAFALVLGGGSAAIAQAPQSTPAAIELPAATDPTRPTGGRELTLAEALRLAEAASEQVAIAEAGVARAGGFLRQAQSARRPQLGASTRYTRTLASQFDDLDLSFGEPTDPDTGDGGDGLGDLPFGQANQYDVGLSLSQTLYAGGRVAASVDAAQAVLDRARTALRSARAATAFTVVGAFYDAALAERLAAIAGASLLQSENALAQTEAAHGVGNTAEFDLLRARVERDNQRPAVLAREIDRDVALLRLRQLLDLPADEPLVLITDRDAAIAAAAGCAQSELPGTMACTDPAAGAVDLAAGLAADLASGARAAVAEAEALVRAQEAALEGARAERRPSVGLGSDYGRVAYPRSGIPGWDETRTNWTVAVGLTLPLYTGGRLAGERAVAEADLSEARAGLQLTREAALLDARDALARLRSANAVWEASAGTVEQARRAQSIAEVRYREGISTQLELSDARLLLEEAEANRAVAERNLRVARARVALIADLPLSAAVAAESPFDSSVRSGGR